jgi:hypothetical protein
MNAPAPTRIVAAVVEEPAGERVTEYELPVPLKAEAEPPVAVMSPAARSFVDSLVEIMTDAVFPIPRRVEVERRITVGRS